MTCGIYKITNKVNGKCYIGASKNIERRWETHQRNIVKKPSRRDCVGKLVVEVHRMIEDCIQLGLTLDDFEFSILETCELENLSKCEDSWIRKFEPVYNSKTYVNGVWIHKGQKEKISNTVLRMAMDQEILRRMNRAAANR